MFDLVKRSLEILKDTAKESGKDYTENVQSLITEAKAIRSEVSQTAQTSVETFSQMRSGGVIKKLSDWFFNNGENYESNAIDGEGDNDDPDGDQDPPQNTDNQVLELLKKLEKRMDQFEVDGKTKDRQKLIKEAMENHKIPTKFRDRLAKSIGDDEDIEETVKAFKQDFITEGLTSEGEQKNKTATEQQVDEAADALLKSITVE